MSSSVNQPRGSWVNISDKAVAAEVHRAGWSTRLEPTVHGTVDLVLMGERDAHTGQFTRAIRIPGNFLERPSIEEATFRSNYVYDAFREAGIKPSAEFARDYPGQKWVESRRPTDPRDPVDRDRPPNKPLPPEPPESGGHRGGPGEG